MSANTFGNVFRVTSFGESHGLALGCIIDGCPAGVAFDAELLKTELERRRPGKHQQNPEQFVSGRNETDEPEVLSGIFEGKTLGTPIAVMVKNQDAKSSDYETIKHHSRAGHADDVWKNKFSISDHRGGGRSSGRETLARVIAGSVAKMGLAKLAPSLKIIGFCEQIGNEILSAEEKTNFLNSLQNANYPQDKFVARFPTKNSDKISSMLQSAQEGGDSYGAQVEIRVSGMLANLGQPVFHKLKADLALAIMGVGAVSEFKIGDGSPADARGTEFHLKKSASVYGGIRGGISTGEDLILKASFKPTSSILDVAKKGRHDPCIAIRAIPVLEAMVAIVIFDHLLWSRMDKI